MGTQAVFSYERAMPSRPGDVAVARAFSLTRSCRATLAKGLMLTCLHCGKPLLGARARTCSVACRNRRYRATRAARVSQLVDEASAALASGDIVGLERAARRTVVLLSP